MSGEEVNIGIPNIETSEAARYEELKLQQEILSNLDGLHVSDINKISNGSPNIQYFSPGVEKEDNESQEIQKKEDKLKEIQQENNGIKERHQKENELKETQQEENALIAEQHNEIVLKEKQQEENILKEKQQEESEVKDKQQEESELKEKQQDENAIKEVEQEGNELNEMQQEEIEFKEIQNDEMSTLSSKHSTGPTKRKRSSLLSRSTRKARRSTITNIRAPRKSVVIPQLDNNEYQDWIHFNKPCDMFVMGQNNVGQLGLGDEIMEFIKPRKVEFKEGVKFKHVTCGGMHTLALSTKDNVYSAGCNDEKALGRKATAQLECIFKPVTGIKGEKVVKVCAGDSYSAALTHNGIVYAWGLFRDFNGPIGLLDDEAKESPVVVYRNDDEPCVNIAGGNNHLMILTSKGHVFTCGSGDAGQLGRVSARDISSRGGRKGVEHLVSPHQVFLPIKSRLSRALHNSSNFVMKIFATRFGSFAVTHDGTIYCWGLNNNKQLSLSDDECIFYPEVFKYPQKSYNPPNGTDLYISGGVNHLLVFDEVKKTLYTMGSSNCGALARPSFTPDETTTLENYEVKLEGDDARFVSVACGDDCGFVVSATGKMYSWGMGCNNQLGVGGGEDVIVPTLVQSKALDEVHVFQVASGSQHTAILCY